MQSARPKQARAGAAARRFAAQASRVTMARMPPQDPDLREVYDRLLERWQAAGPAAVLAEVANRLRQTQRFHDLFEVLKLGVRQRLGLPLLPTGPTEGLSPPQQAQLEEGLIAACREVGLLLLAAGRIREGWLYLRPVGNREQVARELAGIPATDTNLEELIEVSLYEGVDPVRGFSLVLEHHGTCNAITTLESQLPGLGRADQQAAATLLLRHLYGELTENVRGHIARQTGSAAPDGSLGQLVAAHAWLFEGGSYHIDTSHLAAVVRFARLLTDREMLTRARELAEYGQQLDPQLQYPGEEPFAEIYPAHRLYFQAALGVNVDPALEYFRQRAAGLDVARHGTGAVETYLELLSRLGRYREALDAALTMLPPGTRARGWLLELSHGAHDFTPMLAACRQRDDAVGYVAALLLSDWNGKGTTGHAND